MDQKSIVKGWSCDPGSFVSVRPCGDEYEDKTYLGLYVGEVAIGDTMSLHNPCIWVPDLKQYIFGCESWWGVIDSEDDLRKITDADIENVWYVRALKELSEPVSTGQT